MKDDDVITLYERLSDQDNRKAFIEIKNGSIDKCFARKIRKVLREYNFPKDALFDLNIGVLCLAILNRRRDILAS